MDSKCYESSTLSNHKMSTSQASHYQIEVGHFSIEKYRIISAIHLVTCHSVMVSKNHEIRSCICSKLHLHSDASEFRLKIYDAILFLSLRFQ